jgi:hypothetical protein
MINDEIDRNQRIDLLGIAAEHLHRVAHGGEIDHCRTPVKSCISTLGRNAISRSESWS